MKKLSWSFQKKIIFGGASPITPNILKGKNALGRLLMQLREKVKLNLITIDSIILESEIKAFLLYDNHIKEIHNEGYFIDDLDDIYAY